MAEFGKGAGGVVMDTQRGRNDDPTLGEVGLSDGNGDEEVDIAPDFSMLKSGKGDGAARGGVAWSKTSGKKERTAEKQGPMEDPPEGGVLDLDPRVPEYGVRGKADTGFGGKAGEDKNRRGAAEALHELEREQEELDLRPVRPNDRPKNTLSAWKKESDIDDDVVKRALQGVVEDEELHLSPKNTVGTHGNSMPSWSKQVTKGSNRSDLLGIDAEKEELILSPHEAEDNRRRAAVSWSKQADPTEAKISIIEDDHEEVIIHPKKANGKNQKLGVPWNKQKDAAFDRNEELDREVQEQLILSPKDPAGRNSKAALSWQKQPEREFITGREALQPHRSEELILDPQEVRTTRGKNALSWQRQKDAAYDTNKSLDRDVAPDELILSPKRDFAERGSGGNNPPAWKKQASGVLTGDKVSYQQSEELMLSPKDQHKREPRSTLQWSRQSDAIVDVKTSMDHEPDELYLSPKFKAGKASAMSNTSKREGREKRGAASPVRKRDSSRDSKQSVSSRHRRDEGGVVNGSRKSDGIRSTSGRNARLDDKKKRPTTNTKEQGSDDRGSRKSLSGVEKKAPKMASNYHTTGNATGRSGSGKKVDPSRKPSTERQRRNDDDSRKARAPTPPRVKAPTPQAAVPIEGFYDTAAGKEGRSSSDIMASLDRKIAQLELYD